MNEQSKEYIARFYELYINPMEDLLGFMVPELKRGRIAPDNLKKLQAYAASEGTYGPYFALLLILKHAPPSSRLYRSGMYKLQGGIDLLMHQKNPDTDELMDAFLDYLQPGAVPHKQLAGFLGAWNETKSGLEKVLVPRDMGGGPV